VKTSNLTLIRYIKARYLMLDTYSIICPFITTDVPHLVLVIGSEKTEHYVKIHHMKKLFPEELMYIVQIYTYVT
jgi:hypothetical protein